MSALWTKKASLRKPALGKFAIQHIKNTPVYKGIVMLPSLGLCDTSLPYQSCKEAQQVGKRQKRQPSWNESTQATARCAGEGITPAFNTPKCK